MAALFNAFLDWCSGRPGWREWLLFLVAGVMGLLTLGMHHRPAQDYLELYYANPVIDGIMIAAMAIDAACVLIIVVWMIRRRWRAVSIRLLLFATLLGAALIRAELLYGRTFYYGEVRDKHSLPEGLNNGGHFGSEIFIAYFLLRVPLGHGVTLASRLGRTALRLVLLLGSHVGHQLLYLPWLPLRLFEWRDGGF